MSTAASRNLNPRGNFSEFDYDDAQPLSSSDAQTAWITFGVLVVALVAAYENMLRFTATFWVKDMYSHGYIIPFFAAYLFWIRKRPLKEAAPLERWIGVGVLAASLGLRVFSAYFDFNNFERLSFICALLGVCLIIGGKSMFRWAWLPIAFLLFMYPLPSIVENTLLMKLQTWASILSTWTLQTLGVSASRMGNTISVDTLKEPLEVAEACSGLRMLTIFLAMSVALVMIIDRPWWDKGLMLLSAIPIALASNVIRIVSTALLYIAFGQDTPWLSNIIHDWAGLAMMPIGLGLLWIELTILSHITIPIDDDAFASYGAATA
ncbi:exosortase/archaeosortase family protein [Lacipirellula sp.]|uniref:exosortase/archaeosortase family protein n=1 Tax=Lacipirellula sp. TaxID=2691419 RepID=UPI003D12FE9E